MYQLLENYIRLVFENEDNNEQNRFHDIYDSFFNNKEKSNQSEEEDQTSPKEKEDKLPQDPYYYTRPDYKQN